MATWTDADIVTLKAAIAGGIFMVSYTGPPARTIQYQNLREMRALLAEMIGDVAAAPIRYRKVRFRKGFRD